MFREPPVAKPEPPALPREEPVRRRFRLEKLEERIAPLCSYQFNPAGKLISHCSHAKAA